jgi:hypothetical protein
MEKVFEKLIKRVLLPKYPWIKDFIVTVNKKDGANNFYSVRFNIDDELYNEDEKKKIARIRTEIKNLYNVLGPSKNDFLKDVSFIGGEVSKMEESLKKLIRKIILRKYPWIKNFDITVIEDGVQNLYGVTYYVEPDEDGNFTVTDEFKVVESETSNLYRVLGPSGNDWFSGVKFESL